MKINSNKIIEINNLTVSYGLNQNPILKNFQLEINKGDHLALIGASGCGKSTFAKSLIQILPEGSISKGKLLVAGEDLRIMNKEKLQNFRRKTFGYIYQDSIKKLNPLMTIGGHLYELLETHLENRSTTFIKKNVKEIFLKVGIETNRLNSYPHEFSGGMRQRVCIAMALALNPLILIADEPTTSLDAYTSYQIMYELLNLCETFGSTLILISHDVSLAAKWCKKVAIVEKGKIVEQGEIRKVFNSPQTDISKKLVMSVYSSIKPCNKDIKTNKIILEVENLRYWYKLNNSIFNNTWNKALNEVSFYLRSNETLGVVGMSGSGKSTLGKALVGLLNKRGGKINFKTNELIKKQNIKIAKAKNIQMIFQDPFSSINPKMTIRKTLEDVFLIHNNWNKNYMEDKIISILRKLNLPLNNKFLNSYPNQLSGGQLQRVSIARVILIRPKILICDESLNMLDAAVKIEILHLLRSIQKDINLSIIFITHDLGLAKRFCNRILIIDKGHIVEEGESVEIFDSPKNIITKTLIQSCLNIN